MLPELKHHKNVIILENFLDFQTLTKAQLLWYDLVVTTDPRCFWECKKLKVNVLSLDDFASTRQVESECGKKAIKLVRDICAKDNSLFEFAHFELKKILDPFLLFNHYIKMFRKCFDEEVTFYIFSSNPGALVDRYYSESERLFSLLLAEQYKCKKFKPRVLSAEPLKSRIKSWLKVSICFLKFLNLVRLVNFSKKPIVLTGILGRGFEKTVRQVVNVKKFNLLDIANMFTVVEAAAVVFQKKASFKLNRSSKDILRNHSLNGKIVEHFFCKKMAALEAESYIIEKLLNWLSWEKIQFLTLMKASSFSERKLCNIAKNNDVKIIAFTHLAEGYYNNEVVEFIDYIASDIKIIPARLAFQSKIYQVYNNCKLLVAQNKLFREAALKSEQKGINTLFVFYTYPKVNFVFSHYRALGVEQFKIHCEWIKRYSAKKLSTIDIRLYPEQYHQEKLLQDVCDYYGIRAYFHYGQFQSNIINFQKVVMDNFCTSFAEVFCMKKNVTVVDSVFEINDDLKKLASDISTFEVGNSLCFTMYEFHGQNKKNDAFMTDYFLSDDDSALREVFACETFS